MSQIDFQSSLYSEPNSINGGISADGASNLMGATSLSPIEIVLRETLQNSWDASLGQSTQPVFNINVRSLSESEKNCINNFLSELPPVGTFDRERLDKFLVKENKVVLEISDFGTKGLGGPLSASESHEDDKDYDFVNFVKNFGSHKHKENQGGEYGYGKSSFFNISSCRTIIINSLTSYEGKLENRLIGYSLGSAFNFDNGNPITADVTFRDQYDNIGSGTITVNVTTNNAPDISFSDTSGNQNTNLARSGSTLVTLTFTDTALTNNNVVLMSASANVDDIAVFKGGVKSISEIIDTAPILTKELWDLIHWISYYYVTPIGKVFNTVLPLNISKNYSSQTHWYANYLKLDDSGLINELKNKKSIKIKSKKQSKNIFKKYDLIIIATDHDRFNYNDIINSKKTIIDLRGRFRNIKKNNVLIF